MHARLRGALVFGEGIALLMGTIFGAGFLVLPYAALRGGVAASLFWLALFAGLVTVLHLLYSDIVRATANHHRVPGYAKLYLGSRAGELAVVTFIAGVFFGLLVYLLLGSHFLYALLLRHAGISAEWGTVLFWLVMTALILVKLRLSSMLNLAITVVSMSILVMLSIFSLSVAQPSHFNIPPESGFFFPYGIILFSLVGYLAMPEILGLLSAHRMPESRLRSITVIGTLASVLLSGLFMIAILGVAGPETTQDGISGLTRIFPQWAIVAALLLAFLEIATSYLIFGISVRETLVNDFSFSPKVSNSAVAFLPVLLFFVGATDFVKVIGVLGAIWISIDAIFILLIWRKVRDAHRGAIRFLQVPDWAVLCMILVFAAGGIAAIFLGR